MKYSKFNVMISERNAHYLWNTYSNAVAKLDEKTLFALQNLDSGAVIGEGFPYYDYMKKNGFIVEEDVNEVEQLIDRWQSHIDNPSPNTLNITLAPTMMCNYNCPYCFEDGKKSKKTMSRETADAVIAFVRKKAKNNPSLACISISGFGGEPLMNIDMLEYICQAVQNICAEIGIKFKGHIVTNAFFLTQPIAERLVKCGITTAQVSIDGMHMVYARNKGTAPESFNRVINNIAHACKILRITVRINVHENGYNDAVELTDYLLKTQSLDGIIKVYLANIRQYSETDETERAAFSNWCKMDYDYMQLFDPDVGKYKASGLMIKGVKSRIVPCSNICRYNACIGPEGELYPCEHYFGDERYICGSVYSGEMKAEIAERLRAARFPDGKECAECSFAPICLGGCPDDNVHQRKVISCSAYRQHLTDRKLLEIRLKQR